MISDLNKEIISIQYDNNNLPISIIFKNNCRIDYYYDALGTLKLQTVTKEGILMESTDFAGNFVYINGKPAWNNFDEGRVVYTLSGPCFIENYLKDHLGNVRVAYSSATDGTVLSVKQVNTYYPFGMSINSLTSTKPDKVTKNEYLYNGKMFQDELGLNWLDYGARYYDPQIGRFTTQDAYAEKYINLTPYQYAANNPVLFIDVNGDSIQASADAILAIYHALDKNANVHFGVKNGVIDAESFKEQATNSDDIVLKDLYEIASDKTMVELSVSNNAIYKDKDSNIHSYAFKTPYDFNINELSPDVYKTMKEDFGERDGKTIQGNLGITLIPGERSLSGMRSTNENVQIIINSMGSLNHRAVGVAHEFGHVILYLRGLPHGHGQPGVENTIYNERANVVKKRLGYDY